MAEVLPLRRTYEQAANSAVMSSERGGFRSAVYGEAASYAFVEEGRRSSGRAAARAARAVRWEQRVTEPSLAPIPSVPMPRAGSGATVLPAPLPIATETRKRRIEGSFWLLGRAGGRSFSSPSLADAQTGVRVIMPVSGPFFATASAYSPLRARNGRVATLGIGVRRKFAGLIVERRIPLDDGSRGEMAVTAYGGVYDQPLPLRLRMNAYAQGGVVGERHFVDGMLGAERELGRVGPALMSAGGAAWASAQPGAHRIDLGPQLVARLPIHDQTLRLGLEWRQRIAGNATPASGPALSAGIDF